MKFLKKEKGAIFVEAAMVFPVMLIVILLMIYAGNAYFQKCRVEAIVNDVAIEGAARCADSLLVNVEAGNMPNVSTINVYPYRYLDATGVGTTREDMEDELESRIEGLGNGYFTMMKPKVEEVKAIYNYGFIYSTFEVQVEYEIEFPIRMIGDKENISLKMATTASMPVSDSTELIRNVNMVEDYLEQLGVVAAIDELTTKIKDAVSALNPWK